MQHCDFLKEFCRTPTKRERLILVPCFPWDLKIWMMRREAVHIGWHSIYSSTSWGSGILTLSEELRLGEEGGHSWESCWLEAMEVIFQPSFLRPHPSGKALWLFSFLQLIKAHYKVGEFLDMILLRLLLANMWGKYSRNFSGAFLSALGQDAFFVMLSEILALTQDIRSTAAKQRKVRGWGCVSQVRVLGFQNWMLMAWLWNVPRVILFLNYFLTWLFETAHTL